MRLVVGTAAEADVLDAALWYEQRSPGLGREFLRAVDAALAEIAATPERYPVVRGEARRALLHRFPYGVYLRRHSRPRQRHRLHARAPRSQALAGAHRY